MVFRKKITNFYYELTQVALLIDGNVENVQGCRLNVKVHVFSRQKEEIYEFLCVSKETLESFEFLSKIPFAVTMEKVTKADMRQILYWYVNNLLLEYSGEISYMTRTNGWLNYKNQYVYVDGEKAIGLPNVVLKSNRGPIIRDCLKGNLWHEYQNMRHVLKTSGMMDVLLLYVLASYSYTLFEICGKTLKHSLFVVGSRGTRKTAMALCFTQLHDKKAPRFNFLATESGLQAHLQEYKDSCLLLDDLAPSINMSKRASSESKLEMILRLMGDGGGRVINPYFLQTTQKPKYEACGGMVITGEYFYTAGVESSIARAVVLELEKDSVNLQKLSYYQSKPYVLESLIARYLKYVSEKWETLRGILFDVAEDARNRYQALFSNGRYADYMGIYMAQAYLLLEFFKDLEGVSMQELNSFRVDIEKNLYHLLKENDRKMQMRAPIYTILMSILNLEEENRCLPWGTELPREGMYLLETEEAFYVKQKDLSDILKVYCAKTGEPFAKMTSQELGKILCQEEICTVHYEGKDKRLAKKYSQYGNQRYMELKKKMIYKKLGVTNDGDSNEEKGEVYYEQK